MITRIVSNVKTGCDVQLGPKTLIIGPNGAGKSAIVNALELALTGRASDVAGRAEVGSQADLWALAPPGEERIFAKATVAGLDSGASFEMPDGKRPMRSGPLYALPLREVREAILASGENGRKWLMSKLSPSGENWRKRVAGNVEKLASLPDELTSAIDAARAKARDARGRSGTLLDAVRVAGVSRPALPQTAADAENRLAAATAERDRLKASPAPKAPAGADVAQLVMKLQDAHLAQSGKKCAVCGSEVTLDAVRARRVAFTKLLAELSTQASAVVNWHRIVRDAEAEVLAAQAAVAGVRTAQSAVADATAESAERQTAEARRLDREADEWLQIAEALGMLLTNTLDEAKSEFEKRVQKHLPKSDAFGVELQPFRLGLKNGSFLRTALSGAEWARVTIAVALAISNENALAMPEERAWDAATLERVLTSWRDAPIQIVMTSTIEPAGGLDGWTVIHVGGDAVETETKAASTTPFVYKAAVTPFYAEPSACNCPALPSGRKRHALDCPKSRSAKKTAAAPTPDRSGDPSFCAACNSAIAFGPCEHGVGAPLPAPVPDIF